MLAVGGLKEDYWVDACAEYVKRLTRYCKLKIIQIAESNPANETKEIIAKCKGFVFVFDIGGELVSSVELAGRIEKLAQTNSTLTFVIGGSNGVCELEGERVSFGRVTLPHQLFRVVALEQIYRAFTINNGEKYHK